MSEPDNNAPLHPKSDKSYQNPDFTKPEPVNQPADSPGRGETPIDNKGESTPAEKTKWDDQEHSRIVFIADIMGFKHLVYTTNHTTLAKTLRLFMDDLYTGLASIKAGGHLRTAVFSDSIALATDSYTSDNWNLMVKAIAILMRTSLKHGYPLKGCIAKGLFTFDQNENRPLFFGKAGIFAFLQQEEMFYFGVSVHSLAEDDIKNLDEDLKKHFRYKKIPMKSGSARHYDFAWYDFPFDEEKDGFCDENYLEWLIDYEKKSESRVRAYVINTIEVVDQ